MRRQGPVPFLPLFCGQSAFGCHYPCRSGGSGRSGLTGRAGGPREPPSPCACSGAGQGRLRSRRAAGVGRERTGALGGPIGPGGAAEAGTGPGPKRRNYVATGPSRPRRLGPLGTPGVVPGGGCPGFPTAPSPATAPSPVTASWLVRTPAPDRARLRRTTRVDARVMLLNSVDLLQPRVAQLLQDLEQILSLIAEVLRLLCPGVTGGRCRYLPRPRVSSGGRRRGGGRGAFGRG